MRALGGRVGRGSSAAISIHESEVPIDDLDGFGAMSRRQETAVRTRLAAHADTTVTVTA